MHGYGRFIPSLSMRSKIPLCTFEDGFVKPRIGNCRYAEILTSTSDMTKLSVTVFAISLVQIKTKLKVHLLTSQGTSVAEGQLGGCRMWRLEVFGM
jgi:hypothetical protein